MRALTTLHASFCVFVAALCPAQDVYSVTYPGFRGEKVLEQVFRLRGVGSSIFQYVASAEPAVPRFLIHGATTNGSATLADTARATPISQNNWARAVVDSGTSGDTVRVVIYVPGMARSLDQCLDDVRILNPLIAEEGARHGYPKFSTVVVRWPTLSDGTADGFSQMITAMTYPLENLSVSAYSHRFHKDVVQPIAEAADGKKLDLRIVAHSLGAGYVVAALAMMPVAADAKPPVKRTVFLAGDFSSGDNPVAVQQLTLLIPILGSAKNLRTAANQTEELYNTVNRMDVALIGSSAAWGAIEGALSYLATKPVGAVSFRLSSRGGTHGVGKTLGNLPQAERAKKKDIYTTQYYIASNSTDLVSGLTGGDGTGKVSNREQIGATIGNVGRFFGNGHTWYLRNSRPRDGSEIPAQREEARNSFRTNKDAVAIETGAQLTARLLVAPGPFQTSLTPRPYVTKDSSK